MNNTNTPSYDYVVVGAGTAGCVIASRLSEDEDARVLLVEAGAADPLGAMAVPSRWLELLGSSADWGGVSAVQRATGGAVPLPRGRGLGGSSCINGLNFVRGSRAAYDLWPQRGAPGWGFDDLLPFMRRSECAPGRDPALRGRNGPLSVGPPRRPHPLVTSCVEAAVAEGFRRADDISGGLETGFGWTDNTVAGGVRRSAADAYLTPVLARPNLDVLTDSPVLRLVVDGGRCVGVAHAGRGRAELVRASREVVLTAGTIGSAHLLLLSGIGPAAHLRERDVDVVVDLPGVGANLHDHPLAGVTYTVGSPLPRIAENPPGEALGILRTRPDVPVPDLQILFVTQPLRCPAFPGPEEGFTIACSALTPRSRGSVRLASADPGCAPVVDPDYLGDERDAGTMIAGLRIARRIGSSEALRAWRGDEVVPGPAAIRDRDLRAYLDRAVGPYFHYTGTCRIGSDEAAVVDPALRVRGVEGLRVADASVMPSIVNANTAATVYAVAERAADLLATS